MNIARLIALAALALCCSKPLASAPNSAYEPPILAHYMPWYASQPVSGAWGWHWTMNHYDPETIADDDRRQIAAHDYPLIGPYDSNDPHALEYQVLLMKFAGIDGAIVDWYGIADYRDYAALHRNTQHLVSYIKKAGLRFAICYEDQTVKHMIAGGALREEDAVAHGREVMAWLREHWFADEAYVHIDDRPLLLVFGPQHFKGDQWDALFADLAQRPYFFALNSRREGAEGAFGWPPVHGGSDIPPATWRAYLDRLYATDTHPVIATAFPQFHDIYAQASLHDSYGYLDDQNGTVFSETLERALVSPAPLIQLATWNDYGEGTTIEPTREYGYRYLETVQEHRRQTDQNFPYSPDDLRLPILLYETRKQTNAVIDPDQLSALLFADDLSAARSLLSTVTE